MTPNITESNTTLFRADTFTRSAPARSKNSYKWEIRWRNVVFFSLVHLGGTYGLYFVLSCQIKFPTYIFTYLLALAAGLGVTAGAHRLWSHKAFKANAALRILLAVFHSSAYQHSIYRWANEHRVHHKYVDTDADPHNVNRGFFFSHMGWLLVNKLPEVEEKLKAVDMSDIEKDWVVMFQKKYYYVLMVLFCFMFPTLLPFYLWGEDLKKAFFVCGLFRYLYALHATWCINSFAHIWGNKPYDKNMRPTENVYVSIAIFGEGWHNYHHTFPWDYKASEYSAYRTNFTQAFIDFFAWLGWASDLKTVTPEMVTRRVARTGDGSHVTNQTSKEHDMCNKIWEEPVEIGETQAGNRECNERLLTSGAKHQRDIVQCTMDSRL